MLQESYLQWLARHTPTAWWHDSADPDEIKRGLEHGASGVTTNPILTAATLEATPEKWKNLLAHMPDSLSPNERAEYLLRNVTLNAAKMFEPIHEETGGKTGFVCAQVNPSDAGDRKAMFEQARRFYKWAPNIAVKLPATSAGLDVLEDCMAEGITITVTVSFTVSQILAIAQRYRKGVERARIAGRKPGLCFPVIMIGRIDDYLQEVAKDNDADVTETDIQQAGLAITKRAYQLCKKNGYELSLIVAALRGAYHMAGLAGGELIISIHPKIQQILLSSDMPRCSDAIDKPIPDAVIQRLSSMPEFIRAYEPEGLKPEEFITYGVTQRTLSQFVSSGWGKLKTCKKA